MYKDAQLLLYTHFYCKQKDLHYSYGSLISKGGKKFLLGLKHCLSGLPTELNNTIIIDCFIHSHIEQLLISVMLIKKLK